MIPIVRGAISEDKMYARITAIDRYDLFCHILTFFTHSVIPAPRISESCELDVGFGTYMTDLRRVSTEAGLRGEALAADVAVERPILRPLHLSVVIPQVLLQIRQLDEGPPAVR